MSKKFIYAIATMDTKAEEMAFVVKKIERTGQCVKTIDVSTGSGNAFKADVSNLEIAAYHEKGAKHVLSRSDRGAAVAAMAEALQAYMLVEEASDNIAAVIGAGGSGGTSLISKAMRALPIGLPKLLVSTVASGNTQPYVDFSDITMMYSVVDVAGINPLSSTILSNAAHAISGMAKNYEADLKSIPLVGMTMFGVTTNCVDGVRKALEIDGQQCLVFHATGSGGRAMESLISSGQITAALDITTTEVADEVVGGVFACGPARFDMISAQSVPCVMSLGALDMVNFGGIDTVPNEFRNRNLFIHNSEVTLMRTSKRENIDIAKWMAAKINKTTAPFALVIPRGGLSVLDMPDQVFYDQEANLTLFSNLERLIQQTDQRRIVNSEFNINQPEFINLLLSEFKKVQATFLG